MMLSKQILLGLLLGTFGFHVALGQKVKLYDPTEDVASSLHSLLAEAQATDKHIFIQIGGNWCNWCILFNNFLSEDTELTSILDQNYLLLNVNHSRENENLAFLASLNNPQQLGFPVFVILDNHGLPIHTQNSRLLENGFESYDRLKVKEFLLSWTSTNVKLDAKGKK